MTTMPAMHALWLAETRHAFAPAFTASATVWDRARAVTYLRERLIPRFRAEREAASGLTELLEPAAGSALHAAAAVVEVQYERLAWLASFHQKTAEFNAVASEFLRALEYWCSQLDVAADPVRPTDLRLV